MEFIQTVANCFLAAMAILAGAISYYEYITHKRKDEKELFSRLNMHYEKNSDIQAVIMYLRKQEPYGDEPDLYQLEIFLRFFEELGLYIKDKSISVDKVDIFFSYYLRELYEKERGKNLLLKFGHEQEQKLELLQDVKKALNIE